MENVPEPTRINDLISYQGGAIVSRIVIKKDDGNVTLFAFDVAQELSEYTTPYDARITLQDAAHDDPKIVEFFITKKKSAKNKNFFADFVSLRPMKSFSIRAG